MRISSKVTALFQILGLFVIPVTLLASGIIPLWYRFIVLALVVATVGMIMVSERWNAQDIGFRFDTLSRDALPYAFFTLIAIVGLFLYAMMLDTEIGRPLFGYGRAAILAILLSIAQEFLFRSFLIPKLSCLFHSRFIVACSNAILFSFLHILYPDFLPLFPIAFFGGLGFAAIYMAFPNVLLISASHAVLNYATALLGFFTLPSL